MFNADLIIFDLDGTLIDSSKDIAWAVNKTLTRMEMDELPHDVIRGYIGHGVRALLNQAIPLARHHLLESAREIFLGYYKDHLLVETRLYPEVRETLGYFHKRGKRMAVVTNKPLKLTEEILKGLDVARFFSIVLGGDSIQNKKPAPEAIEVVLNDLKVEREKTILVGDSRIDIESGKRAGVLTCGVAYGFRGREELIEAGADAIISEIGELTGLLV